MKTQMQNEYLSHYGVKGMKWGVRHDRKSTRAARRRYAARQAEYVRKTSPQIQSIVDSISDKERRYLGGVPGTPYLKDSEIKDVVKRFIKTVDNTPVAFLDIYEGSPHAGSVGIVTRGGSEYRGKGYASELINDGKKWLETPEAKELLKMRYLDWFALRENQVSVQLAKRNDFVDRDDYADDPDWWGGRYSSIGNR